MRSLLVFLSIVCMLATPLAAADKYGDGPRGVDSDPGSTFDLGVVTYALPLDTVTVPLTFTTSNSVTYIENRITWTDTDLTLVGLSLGPGLPDTLSIDVISQSAGEVRFKVVAGDAVPVGTQPMVYLEFEVGCFGYGTFTQVTLYNDDNFNFYVSGGVPAAPLRDNGSVATAPEHYLYLWGITASAYAGQQDIPWTVRLVQDTPGRVESAQFEYDHTAMTMDSITTLPDLEGGTVTVVSHSDGVVVVDVDSPYLPTSAQNLFTLHFSMIDDRDDFSTPVDIADATRVNPCGDEQTPETLPSVVEIDNHEASADLGDISKTTAATYYDVPFIMHSNHPINAYELRVSFPADQIYFDQVVTKAGFVPPSGGVDPGDTTVVDLNNGSNTDYLPGALPATVAYLRFRPWTPPAAGTVFHLTYVDPHPENEIQYYTDLGAFHDADITALDAGSITITSAGGGGGGTPCCPALYVWNGSGFVLDNNILAECDGKTVRSDVTDYYQVTKPVAGDDGVLRFEVREDADAVSDFSGFELMVVDHRADRDVHVTRKGEVVAANQPFSIQWARDNTGRDITDLISTQDNRVYLSRSSGWIEVSLGKLSDDQITGFAVSTHDAQVKGKDCPILKSQGIDGDTGRKLEVAVRTAAGDWRVLAVDDARHNPARQTTVIPPELLSSDHEVVLRYSWKTFYQIDVLEFNAATPFDGTVMRPAVIDASRAEDGAVVERLTATGGRVSLENGQAITVAFDGSDLPALPDGYAREYVFVATGKYTEPSGASAEAVHAFRLDGNVPNPFNPTTTIRYSLAASARVELSVYDVRGARVRTLVSATQSAGDHTVEWDGRSDNGNALSSGVYFYRLRAGAFAQTRKMVLLK